MRKSKGKWIASYRDIWDLDYTLSPIILAGLVRFKEQIVNSKFAGIPSSFVSGEDVTDEDVANWHSTVDKMIYAFDNKNLPDISDYNFDIQMTRGESKNGSTRVHFKCDNEKEKQRYYTALKDYNEKCKEGRILFATYYENLWH